MGRKNRPGGKQGGQKGKKRQAQRNVAEQMARLGGIRSTPSYMGGGRGVRAFRTRS